MHNTYVSSSVLSLRSRGSLSFSFNDYCNFSNERCDRIPLSPSPSSQCCSCCSCCISFATHGVPINPSFLIGLRQSTLVQWSPCRRRLILAGGNRYFHPFPVYDLDRDSYEVACYIKERYGSGSIEKRRKGRFRCRVSERKNERYQLGVLGDADAVVSLLSDEIGEEAFDGRDRNESSYQRLELEKRRKYGSECYVGNKKRDEPDRRVNYGSQCHTRNDKRVEVQTKLNSGSEFYGKNKERTKVEGRGNYGSESYRGNKKGVGSGLLDSDSKCDYASVTVESGGQAFKRNEGREGSLRGETDRGRRRSSSCSSYYSFSSLEDFESDTEAKDRDVGFVEDLSSGYKEDSGRNAEVRFEGRVVEEFRRHSDDKVRNGEFVEQKYTASGKGVDWDCRKKSEKRLIELSSAEKESREKSSEFRLEMARTRESHYGKASGSLDDKQEESSAVNLNQRRREKYTQSNNQPESRRKYEGDAEMHQSHDGDVEITSQSQKRFSGREENMMVEVDSDWGRRAEHHRTVSHVAGRNDLRKKTHHIIGTSELRSSGTERISDLQCHSESRMKSQQDAANLVQSSVHGAKEQQEQMSQVRIGQMDLIKKSGCFSERSEIRDINIRKTSNLQSETHIKNQEENSGLVSISQAEVKRQHSHAGQEPQRIQSRNGSFDSSSESVAQVGNVLVVSESQRTSEKRMIDQESSLTSVAETTAGTRERPSQTDERVVQTNLGKQGQKPVRQLSSHQKASQQFSSSQASLTSISQERTQQITVDRDKRNSQAILMPPSSQLVDRGSWLDNPTSETATQKVSSETSESGSSALFMNSRRTPPPCGETYVRDRKGGGSAEPLSFVSDDDALNSAHRSEQSSLQIIGEFVEKARHELSTSEIQKEKKTSDSELPSEVENHGRKSSGQYGSEDFQLKPHGLRQLSGGFGAKGPADEMWDVRDPSVQEPAGPDVSEASMATGNEIVKRTGRSLWSIIADVVRLRWGSLAGSPSSGGRSSGKSLSNESVSSDTWFSGREPDETSGENVKRERRSMPQEGMFSHQLEEGQTSVQSQGELSDSMRSKGKSKPHETDKLLSSSILEGQSALRIASLTSGEENLRQNEGGSTSEASVAKEVSRTGKFDAPVSISMEEVKQPVSLSLIEQSGSQRKDGELKQRKLQRNKQVLRDRFDEWEEAYKLEMEQQKIDEMFMREALLEAKKAADTWEVPVGAVLVQHGKIIARGYNLVEELRDSTAHAEMICIREASNLLKSWRLAETTLYVTLEPCPMCAGAILQARIDTVVWGAPNKLLGADGSWIRLFPNRGNDAELTDKPAAPVHPFHPKMTIRRGILASECADAMQQFFQLRRRKKENPDPPSPSPSCLPVANHPSKILTKMHDIFHIMFCL